MHILTCIRGLIFFRGEAGAWAIVGAATSDTGHRFVIEFRKIGPILRAPDALQWAMAKHTVCHIEFIVTDLARAQTFYGGLFDWTFRSFGDDMVVFGSGDQHIGGFSKSGEGQPGSTPSVWFEVEDIDAMVARATQLGGGVVAGKHEVPHVGWAAQVSDLDGNTVGMVQFSA